MTGHFNYFSITRWIAVTAVTLFFFLPGGVTAVSGDLAFKEAANDVPSTTPQAVLASPPGSDATLVYQETDDVRVMTFKEVEAGTTTSTELKQSWGTPSETINLDGTLVWIYRQEPFKTIEVTLEEDLVSSIVIYLKIPMQPDQLAEKLNLQAFQFVSIQDQYGERLGRSYPERGVSFGLHPVAQEHLVSQILLEPISSEHFLLRAKNDRKHQYQQNLTDLEYAIQLDPESAGAHNLKAELLTILSRPGEALVHANRALQLDNNRARFRLTRGNAQAVNDNLDQAHQDIEQVLQNQNTPPCVYAEALLRAGDLCAAADVPDFIQALDYHQKAIKHASPLLEDDLIQVRRNAKKTLMSAHLAVATDIAFGGWRNKKEVVPRWLDRAAAIAEDLIQHEEGDPGLRLVVSQRALTALTGIQDQVNPVEIAEAAIRRAEKIEAQAADPLYKNQISWILGSTLVDVLRIEHMRGQPESARKYGHRAVRLLENSISQRSNSDESLLLLGEAYFRVGSIYAVLLHDHSSGVDWYDKACDVLQDHRLLATTRHNAEIGEWFVSMGVSYWELRDRERALVVTELGTKLIERAVQGNDFMQDLLEIPYRNLAHMYEQMGDKQRAKSYTDRTTSREPESRSKTR